MIDWLKCLFGYHRWRQCRRQRASYCERCRVWRDWPETWT